MPTWSRKKDCRQKLCDLIIHLLILSKVPYILLICETQEDMQRAVSSGRIVGRSFSPKGKQNESPSATLHTFGADVERFKHSFCGRLDLAAEAPGKREVVQHALVFIPNDNFFHLELNSLQQARGGTPR